MPRQGAGGGLALEKEKVTVGYNVHILTVHFGTPAGGEGCSKDSVRALGANQSPQPNFSYSKMNPTPERQGAKRFSKPGPRNPCRTFPQGARHKYRFPGPSPDLQADLWGGGARGSRYRQAPRTAVSSSLKPLLVSQEG